MTAEPNPKVDENPQVDAVEADESQVEAGMPTTEEEPKPLTPKEMDRFECLACGYKYEPAKGDDRTDTPPGIPFQDIPLNWRCPVCGAPKKRFANIGPAGTPSGFKENLNYGLGVNVLTPGQKNILIFGGLILGFLFFLSLYGLR
jgi:rubredoxin